MAGDLERATRAAIAGLYQAFAHRPRAPIQGCPCCVAPADSAQLARLAREDVPIELADRYARKAITTWGDEADFRWYLPRLAELIARGDLTVDLLAEKLPYGGWASWPDPQRAAVIDFLDALWEAAVADGVDGSAALEDLLAARTALALELAPWLDRIDRAAIPALAELVELAIRGRGAIAAALRPRLVTAAMLDRLTADYVATGDARVAAAADLLSCEPALR
jgi:hypothetical protein